jgi:hypothetical protein
MKIIFLDFDGVLNSSQFLKRSEFAAPLTEREAKYRFGHPHSNLDTYDLRMIDHTKVMLLNQIIERTGAQVVISSSWRLGRDISDLRDVLVFCGFVGEVIGVTPELWNSIRGEEINEWLCENWGVGLDDDVFVILDDDDDMGILSGSLVQTSMKTGLTQYDVERAILRLNKNDDN